MSSNESSLQAIVLARTVSTVEIASSYRSGDVSIDPSAIIAPGVLLQAEADSQIIIGAGVCIGLESIIHATGGTLEIQQGSCLAMGVLVIGAGTIGKYVCIGSETTAIDPQIEQGAVIPPHSLLGDRSRTLDTVTIDTEPIVESVPPVAPSLPLESTPDPWDTQPLAEPVPPPIENSPPLPPLTPPATTESDSIESTASAVESAPATEASPPTTTPKSVAGIEHFNRLRRKLFPDANSV